MVPVVVKEENTKLPNGVEEESTKLPVVVEKLLYPFEFPRMFYMFMMMGI